MMQSIVTKKYLDVLTYKIIGAAIEVHKILGPGLLESVYQKCLKREFQMRGLRFIDQIIVPIEYKGIEFDTELRCDFLVEDTIALEIKAVDALAPVFDAQTLSYMNLLKTPKGILINFNCVNIFKEGQRTFVNELFRALPDD